MAHFLQATTIFLFFIMVRSGDSALIVLVLGVL